MVAEKLGFDLGWADAVAASMGLRPEFPREVLRQFPDGSRHVRQVMGGYIPCPDHRIPLEAEWDLVSYYCERMRKTFAK